MEIINLFRKAAVLFFCILLSVGALTAQNNIISNTQDCGSTRPPFSFSIQNTWVSNTSYNVHNEGTPLVGDLDGDGFPEIVAVSADGTCVYVFDGRTGAVVATIVPGVLIIPPSSFDISFPGLICDSDGNGKGEVFIVSLVSQVMFLYEVTSAPGVRPMTFAPLWANRPVSTAAYLSGGFGGMLPVVADFEGDGVPEFIVEGQIIDSQTGNVLTVLPLMANGAWGTTTAPYVADIDGDGLPEILVGTDIYKYAAGAYTLLARCPSYVLPQEGFNMVADINQDGLLDVVYSDSRTPTNSVTVWTPSTNTVIGSFSFPSSNGVSYPFVGDIDGVEIGGKKYPEICLNTAFMLYAYSFNGTNFFQKWSMTHTDQSAMTSITLYDFNLDGMVELVYRDMDSLRIFDGSGSAPVSFWSAACGSITTMETPVIADVTGDGSANIIVTGHPLYLGYSAGRQGEVMVFEGMDSKWASCPKVWNQQLYSNLLVNEDLTIPLTIEQPHLTFVQSCSGIGKTVQYYNGGPMQAPYLSDATYCPIDLSPDVFIVSGTLTELTSSLLSISITVGNQGLAMAPQNTPIRYYLNSIMSSNILADTTLSVDLWPGQTTTITKTATVSSGWVALYVRLLDDGINFPASGTFSDCDLTNNTKSFGTMELTKEIDQLTSCIDNIRAFTVKLKNDDQTQTYTNILLTDSLSAGWIFISATPCAGTSIGSYNPVTRSIEWTIPSLAPGDSADLVIYAQVSVSGSIRNYVWVESVDGTVVERDYKSAYVIASSYTAPTPPVISPSGTVYLCPPAIDTLLTASGSGVSYQWYHDGIAIPGANFNTYRADTAGFYTVTLFDGNCTSNRSDTVALIIGNCKKMAFDDIAYVFECGTVLIDVLANDEFTGNPIPVPALSPSPLYGTVSVVGNWIQYTDVSPCDAGKIDTFKYSINANGTVDTAMVRVAILYMPKPVLTDSCSFAPKLVASHQYDGATYVWEYSDDGIGSWTTVGTNATIPITEPGYYRVTTTYRGLTGMSDTVKINVKKTNVQGGVWYETHIE